MEERTGFRSGDPHFSGATPDGRWTGAAEPPRESPILCDLCASPMLERHCKLVCLCCGFMRDCTDP